MFGTLTSDYDIALKIKSTIEKLKIVRHSQQTSYIYGYHQVTFLYSDEESRMKHESDMILRGWTKVETQTNVSIYSNLYSKVSIRVPCAVYEKSVTSLMDSILKD